MTADTTKPTILSAVSTGDNTRVTVLYSEPVEAATATNAANYSLNFGATVGAVRFAGDNHAVLLETSSLTAGQTYTLTVNNVRDRAATPNTILPNSTIQFSLSFTPLDIRYVLGTNEPAGPSSRRTGLAITEIMPPDEPGGWAATPEFIELCQPESPGGGRERLSHQWRRGFHVSGGDEHSSVQLSGHRRESDGRDGGLRIVGE